jgi:hypothetical protein
MNEVHSGTGLVEETACPYVTSVPIDDRWGQLPASLYTFTINNDTMYGQVISGTEQRYVSRCPGGYPAEVDSRFRPDQGWFWTLGWQAMEQEADEDIASGHYDRFDTMDDFIEDLESLIEA